MSGNAHHPESSALSANVRKNTTETHDSLRALITRLLDDLTHSAEELPRLILEAQRDLYQLGEDDFCRDLMEKWLARLSPVADQMPRLVARLRAELEGASGILPQLSTDWQTAEQIAAGYSSDVEAVRRGLAEAVADGLLEAQAGSDGLVRYALPKELRAQ